MRFARTAGFCLAMLSASGCQNVPQPPACAFDNDCDINRICEDGSCIPPPPHPSGTAASLIRDDAGLILAARAGGGPLAAGGKIEIARSTDGSSWHTVSTAFAEGDARAPALGLSGDGKLLLAFAAGATFPAGDWVPGKSDRTSIYVTDSGDGGASFSVPRKVDLTPFSYGMPHGRIVRLDSGVLLLPLDVWYLSDNPLAPELRGEFTAVSRSPDNGRTWYPPLVIARNHREPVVAILGSDHLVALLRSDDGRLAISASHDESRTWSVPFPLIDAERQPGDLLRLDDRRLVLSFVSKWPVGAIQLLFSDNGESFGLPFRSTVVNGPVDAALGALTAETHDGTLVTMTAAVGTQDRIDRASHGKFTRYHESDLTRTACSDIGSGKQLFLDEELVESTSGVAFRVHPPGKTHEVLVHADQPWEGFIAGNYPVVIAEGPKVRLWYEAYGLDYALKGDYGARLCYAESIGGKPFVKPDLMLVPYQGSLDTNIVFPTHPEYLYHGGTVFADPNGIPEERYKLVAMGDNGVRGAVSPDGFSFTRLAQTLVGISSDTQNVGYWDDQIKRYVVYLRKYEDGRRIITRAESRDFRVFSLPHVIMRPDAQDGPDADLYNSAATKYAWAPNAYFMFVSIYDHKTDTLAVQLATSRDGIHFIRYRDPWWLPLGPEGSFDSESIYQAPGIIRDSEELYVYYAGFSVGHNSDDPSLAQHVGTVSRALFRLDGFRAAETPAGTTAAGTLTTIPITFQGSKLHINAIGRVRAALLYQDDLPVPGFTMQQSIPFDGDAVDAQLKWMGVADTDLAALAGKPIKLRFELTSAQLYAYGFRDN